MNASVEVEGKIVGKIGTGLLIFLGIGANDDGSEIPFLTKKVSELRIFSDKNGKMNLSLNDIKGEILLISQFTLYANTKRGRRPDFIDAAKPEKARELYHQFGIELENLGIHISKGIFGANMKISLINDGPVTIILEK